MRRTRLDRAFTLLEPGSVASCSMLTAPRTRSPVGSSGMGSSGRSSWGRDRMSTSSRYGMTRERRYWHTVVGYNYRLTNIQAVLANEIAFTYLGGASPIQAILQGGDPEINRKPDGPHRRL